MQPVGTAMIWDSLLKNKYLVTNCWDVIILRLEIGGKTWGKGKQCGCAGLLTCSHKVNVTTASCSEPCTAFQAHCRRSEPVRSPNPADKAANKTQKCRAFCWACKGKEGRNETSPLGSSRSLGQLSYRV